jgi:4-hydroxybenzoate polyprenyltransferase
VNLFKTYSLFRLTKTIPVLLGVYTITLHAYGSREILHETSKWTRFLISEGSLFAMLSGGYLMNDLLDLENNKINRQETVYIDSSILVN